MEPKIGALVIGQSPRPDLTVPLRTTFPDHTIIEAGALDSLTHQDLPHLADAAYPLTTHMQDGTLVTVTESFLLPYLQAALQAVEAQDVVATILLCAGSFSALWGRLPLFKPFDVTCATLRALNARRPGILSPIEGQRLPTLARWQAAGFAPTVWVTSPSLQDAHLQPVLEAQATGQIDCLVLDYVGHSVAEISALQTQVTVPLLDLGHVTIRLLASVLHQGAHHVTGM